MLALLDRDGVLNEDRRNHVRRPDELVMIESAAGAVARLVSAGWKVAVVTNQSGLGRGYYDDETLRAIHARLDDALRQAGGLIDRYYICPDPPWAATNRRKPQPGMVLEALGDFSVSPGDAVMIGDAVRDLEAAATAGVRRILVRTGKGEATLRSGWPEHLNPVTLADDIGHAVSLLLDGGSVESMSGDGRGGDDMLDGGAI